MIITEKQGIFFNWMNQATKRQSSNKPKNILSWKSFQYIPKLAIKNLHNHEHKNVHAPNPKELRRRSKCNWIFRIRTVPSLEQHKNSKTSFGGTEHHCSVWFVRKIIKESRFSRNNLWAQGSRKDLKYYSCIMNPEKEAEWSRRIWFAYPARQQGVRDAKTGSRSGWPSFKPTDLWIYPNYLWISTIKGKSIVENQCYSMTVWLVLWKNF